MIILKWGFEFLRLEAILLMSQQQIKIRNTIEMYIHPSLEITEIGNKNRSKYELNTKNSADFEELLLSIIIHKKMTVIQGTLGIGKTTFLNYIKKYFLALNNDPKLPTYTILINFQKQFSLNVEIVFDMLREQEKAFKQVSIDELKNNLKQGKFKLILLLDQFEEIIISSNNSKQSVQEIKKILETFQNEFKTQIYLTVYTDFLEKNGLKDLNVELIIDLQPFRNYQIREYFANIQANYLEENINQKFMPQNEILAKLVENEFKDKLYLILLENSVQEVILQNIRLWADKLLNENETSKLLQALQTALSQKPLLCNFMQKLKCFNLKTLSEIPEMLKIIVQLLFYGSEQKSQYQFYLAFLNKLLQYRMKKLSSLQQISISRKAIKELQSIAIEIKIAEQNENKFQQQNQNYQFIWKYSLMKHECLVDFFVSMYFVEQISKLESDSYYFLNQKRNTKLIKIRDSRKIGQLDFSSPTSFEILNFLKDDFQHNEDEQKKLITFIKASAEVDNFEQEAGNAMMVLSHVEANLKNINFSNVRIKNSSLNKIRFSNCKFNHSIMNNVSIQSAQFIQCEINDAQWNNIESNFVKHLSQRVQTNFTTVNKVMISVDKEQYVYFWNQETENQIKRLYQKSKIQRVFNPPKRLKQIFVCESQFDIVIWNISCGKIMRTKDKKFLSFYGEIMQMSPSLSSFAITNKDKTDIQVYRIQDHKKIFSVQEVKANQMTLSPDGNILGLKGIPNRIWKIKDGKEIIFDGKLGTIQGFEFSPDSQIIAISLEKKGLFLCLWSLQQNKPIYQQKCYMDSKFQLTFSPNQQILAIYNKQKISILMIQNWKHEQIVDSYSELGENIVFMPNEKYLAFSNQNKIFLWGIYERMIVQILGVLSETFESLSFSSDGQFLLSKCQGNGEYLFWKTKLNLRLQTQQMPPSLISILFSENNQILACLDSNKTISLRQVDEDRITQSIALDCENLDLIVISPNLSIFATTNREGQISFHEMLTGQHIIQLDKFLFDNYQIERMKFSPDGRYLACQIYSLEFETVNYNCQYIFVLEVESGQKIFKYKEVGKWKFCMEFLQEDIAICKGNYVKFLNIWDQTENSLIIESSTIEPKHIAYSPFGLYFAAVYEQETDIWGVSEKKKIDQRYSLGRLVCFIQFSPDCQTIAFGNTDHSIYLWDMHYKMNKVKLQQQEDITQIVFSPNGRVIASKGQDSIYLWKLDNCPINQIALIEPRLIGRSKFKAQNCTVERSQFNTIDNYNCRSIFQKQQ